MRRWRSARLIVATFAAGVLAFGCTSDEQPGTAETTPPAPSDDDADGAAADDPDADEADADGEGQDGASPSGTIEFRGLQQVHPHYVMAGITAVTVDDGGHIILDLEVFNRFAASPLRPFHDGVRLEDDLGNTYPPVAREDEGVTNVSIPANHRAEISLVFEGPIDAAATQVNLAINSRDGFLDIDTPTNQGRPRFSFLDVPLPGVGSDDQDAGPGGGRLLLAPVTREFDDQVMVSDPTGVTVELRSVTVAPLSVEVEVHARNDTDVVAALTGRGAALLVEHDGEVLDEYVFTFLRVGRTEDGSERAARMTMEPGEEVEGRLVFRGGVPPQADAFRIGFNQNSPERLRSGEPEEDVNGQIRSLFLNVPLPELPTYGDDDDA